MELPNNWNKTWFPLDLSLHFQSVKALKEIYSLWDLSTTVPYSTLTESTLIFNTNPDTPSPHLLKILLVSLVVWVSVCVSIVTYCNVSYITLQRPVSRWSGDVIRRTGMKNFKAVSHNRARPYFRIQHGRGEVRARRVYLNVHSVTGNVVDTEWSVEFWRWKCCRESGKQHLRPRAVVEYGVKIFLPSPPNYVTRSPGRRVPGRQHYKRS